MKTRTKAPAIKTRAEFERIVDEIAAASVALRKLEAARDQKLQAVRAEWEPACVAQEERIKTLSLLAEKFAEEHRGDLLAGKAKSVETPLAMCGFRTGMPKLKLLSKWTWERVLATFKDSPWDHVGVRWVAEVNKAGIIAAEQIFEEAGSPLSDFGVKVVQDETFFIEPKETPAEAALT